MKPTFLFIDSSCYEQHCFQFGNEPLSLVAELANVGYLKLVCVEIGNLEVEKRIRTKCMEVELKLRQARNEMTIARGHHGEPYDSLSKDKWLGALANGIESRFQKFVSDAGCLRLNLAVGAAERVFMDYFLAKPPFDLESKKHEFPDGFMMDTLIHWQRETGEKLVVVSADGDFKRTLMNKAGFRVEETLEPVLRDIYGAKVGHNKAAESLVKRSKRKIANQFGVAFRNSLIFMNGEDIPLNRNFLEVDEVKILSYSRINTTGRKVSARFEAEFAFTVNESIRIPAALRTPLELPVHTINGTDRCSVTLPANVTFVMSDDSKRIAKIINAEVNDGLPLELDRISFQ